MSFTLRTPFDTSLAAAFSVAAQHECVWLDSAIGADDRGQRSLLCLELEPVFTITTADVAASGPASLWTRADAAWRRDQEAHAGGLGWVGYVAYEAGNLADAGLPNTAHDLPFPLIRFDRVMVALARTGDGVALVVTAANEAEAHATTARWIERISATEPLPPVASLTPLELPDRALHEQNVATVLSHIERGRVYQACYTFPLRFARPAHLASAYVRLRDASPGDFGAYLHMGELEAASTSPERFLRIHTSPSGERVATCRPMKGTRPRHADAERDAAVAADLAASEKDRAENVMIVDLMRNDLGKVCRLGSVTVPRLFEVEHYETVHQMTSTVTGVLRDDVGPFGVLEAVFPPGSMTGAPKVAACHLLAELESEPRGLYSGTIGWLGFDGTCEFSVVIRTLQAWGDTARWNVGGGVVWDSTPEGEFEEALAKAAALRRAGLAE